MSASMRPSIETCRVYREARARYAVAFEKGDVNAIEDAFSRMQEIVCAFRDGVRWKESRTTKNENGRR